MQLTEHFNSDEFACHCGCGYDDIDMIGRLGKGRVNVTVGSALDLFGGNMNIDEIIKRTKRHS